MKRNFLIAVALFVISGLAYFWKSSQPVSVKMVTPTLGPAESSILVSGTLEAANRAKVVSEITNRRVRLVLADLGKVCQSGSVLLELENDQERSALDKAQAQLRAGEANLAKAERLASGSEAARVIARANLDDPIDLKRAVSTGTDSLRAAQERLSQAQSKRRRTLAGSRPEDIKAAEAELASATATLQLREMELARTQKLVNAGALAGARLDEAEAAQRTAAANVATARQKLVANREPRPEDAEEAESAVREAQANVRVATSELEAARLNLLNRRALANQLNSALTDSSTALASVAAARADVESARASVLQATQDLARTVIRSPIAGVVSLRDIQVGETVDATRVLFQISSRDNLRVRLDVDEKYAPQISLGMAATVIADSIPNLKISAKVAEIASQSNKDRGTVEVRLHLDRLDPRLRADQTVSATLVTLRLPKVITVPADAILREGDKAYVAVITNGKVRKKEVTSVILDNERVWIQRGLQEGEQIVADPRATGEGTSAKPERTS
jgi:HlyD family secretion protein